MVFAIRNFREMDIYLYINEILFKFLGSPGTPSSSPPAPYSSSTQPRNGGSGGGKLPDENSNMAVQVDRHDSISPASMDSSIQEDERANKSKANQSSNFVLLLVGGVKLLWQRQIKCFFRLRLL